MRTILTTMAVAILSIGVAFAQNNKELAILRQMAAQGNASAAYQLGIAYFYAEFGAPLDQNQGILYLRKAADGGNQRAAFELGAIYYELEAYTLAMPYLTRCAEEFSDACFMLGNCYANGLGVETDPQKAKLYYRKAAQAGHEQATKLLKNNR